MFNDDIPMWILNHFKNSGGGGGTTINGDLVSTIVQSGSVSKGDFIKYGYNEKADRFSSTQDYNVGSSYVRNPDNMIDNNDDTYTTMYISSNTPRIYVACKSAARMNIPLGKRLKSLSITYKIDFLKTTTSSGRRANLVLYNGAFDNTNVVVKSNVLIDNMDNVFDGYPRINTMSFDAGSLYGKTTDDLNKFGLHVYSSTNNDVIVYYVKFNIQYEDNGKIISISSEGEEINGIANENGNQGDTVQVYVPHIS